MNFKSLGAFLCLLLLVSCASQSPMGESTVRVDEVKKSGFLEDYSILKQGGEGEASLVYWDQNTNFSAYDKVIVDPVTVWLGAGSNLNNVSPKERQQLANEFHAAIVKKLGEDYRIVKEAGPGTMRVRVALTDAQESNPTLDTISTYIPQARLLQTIVTMGSDTAGFVGEASAEGEVRDAETGALLAAGVDRRAGTKSLGDGTFDSWDDARKAFEAWADQFSANLKKRQ
ncbi:MAG: DUF3313 domain-containing protein [Candidatus Poribacteria bacterium]|nr:DUF3313 domain-containing protein [Candidatus Poribacteria bacterium]